VESETISLEEAWSRRLAAEAWGRRNGEMLEKGCEISESKNK
jgi:hypothetical protein